MKKQITAILIGAEERGMSRYAPYAIKHPNDVKFTALREGPYGRCVFRCDNDVVDHQVVNIEFENKVTASFTMCAFTNDCSRTIKLMGTKGEIRGAMEKNEIEITDFLTGTKETMRIKTDESGHSGGDFGMMHDFVRLLQNEGKMKALTSAQHSVHSHLMSFAAEESRLNHKIYNIMEFKKQFTSK